MKWLAACIHFTKWPTQRASSARGLRDSCLMPDFPSRKRRTENEDGKHSDVMAASSARVPKARRRKPSGYFSWKRRIAAAGSARDGGHPDSVEIDHGRDADEEPGGAAKDVERNARVDGGLCGPMNERIARNSSGHGEDSERD